MMQFLSCLLTALEPFPEARLAAADALEQGGWMTDPTPHEETEGAAAQQDAVAEPVRDIPAEVIAPAEGCAEKTETKTQPNSNETTTKVQPTNSEPAAKPAPSPTPAPRNGLSPWDPLDAKHWIVFSSS
jgi:hypothetical protein